MRSEGKKKTSQTALLFRGTERIRTAVQAFAELCLATRPRCHAAKIQFLFFNLTFFLLFVQHSQNQHLHQLGD